MERSKSITLGEPKYRICSPPNSTDANVVFFCDWDYVHSPETSFIGKPIYFQSGKDTQLPFRSKQIMGEIYSDMSKIRPQSLYVCDLGLKLLCETMAPGLLLDNSNNVLQTLCLVPTGSVIQTISSRLAREELVSKNPRFKKVLQGISLYLGKSYTLGVVGYHALNPLCDDDELDLVVIADTIEQLNDAKRKIDQIHDVEYSGYLSQIWPLSKRTSKFGSLDLFWCTANCPSPILLNIESAEIITHHFEFDSVVIDDSMGILGTPIWKTEGGEYLLGLDNALRGRLHTADHVVGVGVAAQLVGGEFAIIIQSEKNVSHVIHC